jgi:hypothetical protein
MVIGYGAEKNFLDNILIVKEFIQTGEIRYLKNYTKLSPKMLISWGIGADFYQDNELINHIIDNSDDENANIIILKEAIKNGHGQAALFIIVNKINEITESNWFDVISLLLSNYSKIDADHVDKIFKYLLRMNSTMKINNFHRKILSHMITIVQSNQSKQVISIVYSLLDIFLKDLKTKKNVAELFIDNFKCNSGKSFYDIVGTCGQSIVNVNILKTCIELSIPSVESNIPSVKSNILSVESNILSVESNILSVESNILSVESNVPSVEQNVSIKSDISPNNLDPKYLKFSIAILERLIVMSGSIDLTDLIDFIICKITNIDKEHLFNLMERAIYNNAPPDVFYSLLELDNEKICNADKYKEFLFSCSEKIYPDNIIYLGILLNRLANKENVSDVFTNKLFHYKYFTISFFDKIEQFYGEGLINNQIINKMIILSVPSDRETSEFKIRMDKMLADKQKQETNSFCSIL